MSKYVRLWITDNNGGSNVTVVEMECFTTAGGKVDLCINGTATTNGQINGSNSVSMAFDNNLVNKWSSLASVPTPGNPHWIQYEFAGDPAIQSYSIVGCLTGQEVFALRDWELQISDNGTDWTTIDIQTDQGSWSGEEKRSFDIQNNSLSGTTEVNGVPTQCTVRLYENVSGVLVQSLDSDPVTGAYQFNLLSDVIDYDIACLSPGVCPQMNGSFNAEGAAIPPYEGEVTLFLEYEGGNGSLSFVDSSQYANVITPQGTAQISTAEFHNGTSSLLLDGTRDYLTVTHQPGLFSTIDDFTIETWVYRTDDTTRDVLASKYASFSTDGFTFQIREDNTAHMSMGSGTYQTVASTSTIPVNQWVHIAAVKNGADLSIYIDGTLENTITLTGTPNDNTANLNIGADSIATDHDFIGYMDNFIFTQGYAKYTTNFAPV